MKKLVLAFCGFMIFLNGCSSNSASSTGTSTIEGLPKATGAVSASSISKASSARFDLQTAASTGVLMTAWDNQTWNGTKSAPGCNIGNMIVRLLS